MLMFVIMMFCVCHAGTSADHHVHHKLYKYNYGHLFVYWDVLFGTYKAPQTVSNFSTYRTDKQRIA